MDALLYRWSTLEADEAGVTAIEYGLISALLVTAIVSGISFIGANLTTIMSQVAMAFVSVQAAAP